MSSTPDDVELAFYEAMQHADLDLMMECWAEDEDIICIHPHGERLVGHAAIRASFEQLFQAAESLDVKVQNIVKSKSLDGAMHSVVEVVPVPMEDGVVTGYILATNVYLRTAHGWRMVAHHASPASMDMPVQEAANTQTLH